MLKISVTFTVTTLGLGLSAGAVPRGIKGNKEGKPGFQIYVYLVSYVLSTSTNMQLSSYKLAFVVASVPDIQSCLLYLTNIEQIY